MSIFKISHPHELRDSHKCAVRPMRTAAAARLAVKIPYSRKLTVYNRFCIYYGIEKCARLGQIHIMACSLIKREESSRKKCSTVINRHLVFELLMNAGRGFPLKAFGIRQDIPVTELVLNHKGKVAGMAQSIPVGIIARKKIDSIFT